MTETAVITARDDLSAADMAGELVVLDLASGAYFGLNETGTRILKLARQPRTVQEIIEALRADYEVPYEQLKADVLAFVADLAANRLIRVEPAEAPRPTG